MGVLNDSELDAQTRSVGEELEQRIARAAEDVTTADQLHRTKVAARNALVLEAVDRHQLSVSAVARAAGITRQRVLHILTGY